MRKAETAELAICLDGAKARKILGFKPMHPKVEVAELRAIVKGFQDDGIWYFPCTLQYDRRCRLIGQAKAIIDHFRGHAEEG